MSMNEFLFYALSSIIVVFSLLTVNSRRMLRAATWLLVVLVATAGIYMLMTYQFMAAVQLSVYAGGIVVLIIFSIFLTSHINHKFEHPSVKRMVTGGIVSIAGLAITVAAILSYDFQIAEPLGEMEASVENVGRHLVSTGRDGYALIFEAINVLLLAAIVGGIVIARKENKEEKNNEKA
jgi:NADH-quinone oxidoreductase subunit J